MKIACWLVAAVLVMIGGALRAEGPPRPLAEKPPGGELADPSRIVPAGTAAAPGIAFGAARDTGFYLHNDGGIGVVLSGIEEFTYDQRGLSVNRGLLLPKVDPSIVTCPVSNCPRPNPVLSAVDIHGQTRRGAETPEWESVIGMFSATGDPDGQKVVQYLGGMQAPGAGSMWTFNTDVVRNATPGGRFSVNDLPGSGTPGRPGGIGRADGTVGYELDLTNWSEDDAPGGPFVVGMFINTLSSYSSLAGIYYGSAKQQTVPSWHDGIFFSSNTIKDNSVFDAGEASFSYQVAGSHLAAFYDNSRSQTGLAINGTHSEQDILLSDRAPVGIAVEGTHSTAAITVKSGEKVCFDTARSCITYDAAHHKWFITGPSGTNIASIDDDGNMIMKGRILQGQEP